MDIARKERLISALRDAVDTSDTDRSTREILQELTTNSLKNVRSLRQRLVDLYDSGAVVIVVLLLVVAVGFVYQTLQARYLRVELTTMQGQLDKANLELSILDKVLKESRYLPATYQQQPQMQNTEVRKTRKRRFRHH